MLPVTLITENASQDPVSEETYLAGLNDLVASGPAGEPLTWRALVAYLNSQYSPAWWNLRARGERPLTREGKTELRAGLDNLPPLPESVSAVAARLVDPDAQVLWLGELSTARARRVLLLAPDLGEVFIHINGTVTVTPVPAPQRGAGADLDTLPKQPETAPLRRRYSRNKRHRLTVSTANKQWLDAQSLTADEAINKLRDLQK